MNEFSTEFPVAMDDIRSVFLSELFGWLRGIKDSSVLDEASTEDLELEYVHLRTEDGEELRVRELKEEKKISAIGFRHDIPDLDGRIWRTEAVLRANELGKDQHLFKIRAQCVAQKFGAELKTPRKAYLIKEIIANGYAGNDEEIRISDTPHFISDDSDGLEFARSIVEGKASKWLPIIYISSNNDKKLQLDLDEIKRLAYEMGGVAHVVVEPSRAFSIELRGLCGSRNAYGGAIGLSLPGYGLIRRYYLGIQIQSISGLVSTVRSASVQLRSQMPSLGWDWTDLQEKSLRLQRERYKHTLSRQDIDDLLDEQQNQIDDLQEENARLKAERSSKPAEGVARDETPNFNEISGVSISPEIYEGEIWDRIRLSAKLCVSFKDQIGLDKRSEEVLKEFLTKTKYSESISLLLEDILRATKDNKRTAKEITPLLRRCGYTEKSHNKHIRMEPDINLKGVLSITLSKTPSDPRASKNTRKQVKQALGITRIVD